jgi:D-arginine dehydrogenase
VETAEAEADFRELTPPEVRRLAPHFAGAADAAFYFPREGRIDISALCQGFARAEGVHVRTGTAVDRLIRRGDRVVGVRLQDATEMFAENTVIAAGGWAGRLGATARSRLELFPTRRHLAVTAPDPRIDPGWPVVWSLSDRFYCRPESGGLLLSACDQDPIDPDACTPSYGACEIIAERAARLLPELADLALARLWCGMRTMAADGRFVIGPDPDLAGLSWVAGLGGHGMVCAFEVGRLAAASLIGRRRAPRLARAFDPRRLAA